MQGHQQLILLRTGSETRNLSFVCMPNLVQKQYNPRNDDQPPTDSISRLPARRFHTRVGSTWGSAISPLPT